MSRRFATPWAPESLAYALPGSLLVKMRLGEAPEQIPTSLDVRQGMAKAAVKMDGQGVFDRLVRAHAHGVQITRLYPAAQSLTRRGARHIGFDDLEHHYGMSRSFRLEMERGTPVERLASVLRQLPTVESATPHYCCHTPFAAPAAVPVAVDLGAAWSPRDMVQGREALAYETGDPSVVTAIVDTGVSADHRETNGRFRGGYDTVQLAPNDFAQGMALLGAPGRIDTRPVDEYVGHGMACAGIIGARGERIPPGLGGNCWLLPVRVLGAARLPGKTQAVGLGAIADIDLGVKMAIDLGARVLNMSFGTPDDAVEAGLPKPHGDVIRYAAARGCILVAASGNSGKEEQYWPAAFDEVIAVGAVDNDRRPSRFTSRGKHVALCAPGERIATCALEGAYQLATGTSFAAPFVAAAAALLLSRASRRSFPLDGEIAKQVLIASATPWTRDEGGCGSGILNVYQALQELDRRINQDPATEEMLYAEADAVGAA
jgi:subtilisin family serine protease